MAKADENKSEAAAQAEQAEQAERQEAPESTEGAPQRYNPYTAKWEPEEDSFRIAEHEAQRAGKKAPGDRTEAQLRRLEGGAGAPVLTSNANVAGAADAGTTRVSGGAGGATGGATGATGRTS